MEAIRLTVYEAADLVPDTYMGEYYSPSIPVYKKAEADAEFARLEHQIKVLNADLTRCQDSKAKFGDKILRLEDEVERLRLNQSIVIDNAKICQHFFKYFKGDIRIDEFVQALDKIDS